MTVDETLLALKVGFLILLYIFVWLVVRSATRGLEEGAPQESMIIPAPEAAALRASHAPPSRRVVVVSSPTLQPGTAIDLTNTAGVGRGPENAIRLDGDTTVSSRHATLDSRADGLWVEDAGSTNGTFVNGARVTSARMLVPGDVLRIGHTDLRVEA
ncbi:MAG TPA: FHA domain-containing protein [Gaiella sp.]|nr:FHA domain-containing protein [Gaiella sp.]